MKPRHVRCPCCKRRFEITWNPAPGKAYLCQECRDHTAAAECPVRDSWPSRNIARMLARVITVALTSWVLVLLLPDFKHDFLKISACVAVLLMAANAWSFVGDGDDEY